MSNNGKFTTSVAPSMPLGQAAVASSDISHSAAPLLTTQQLPTMVSLPQSFCFTSQPSQQTSVTPTQPPSALSVTLGFPVAPAAALNTGTIPQQFVQSLSVGQQPAICASLPQNFSLPLNQALFTVPNAGTSTGQFLSTTFNQFQGIPSLIMGGQQPVLSGTLVGTPPVSAPAQLQTLGTLAPQSLSFPITTGPVVTEIPPDQQQQQPQTHQQTSTPQVPQPLSTQPEQQTQQQQQPPPSEQPSQPPPEPQQQPVEQQQEESTPVTEDAQQTSKEVQSAEVNTDQSGLHIEEPSSGQTVCSTVDDTANSAPASDSAPPGDDQQESTDNSSTERKAADNVEDVQPASEPSSAPAEDRVDAQDTVVKEEEAARPADDTEQPREEDPGTDLLLMEMKQEVVEEDEDEEMPLPDSTPVMEESESLDSYSQRQSPSPMASLQLTRADTTTTTTTAYTNSGKIEDGDVDSKLGLVDVTLEGVPMEFDESEFVWEDYLQETGATAVPPTAFKHVECSLQSGFVKGMRVEVANKSVPGTYWVASLVMTCGPLLRLRYEGYDEDGSADFWCDLSTCDIHPIGWCQENGQKLEPPAALQDKFADWQAELQRMLKGVKTAPSYLLDKTTGTTPIDQLKQGMRLELQDEDKPNNVWLARIVENVGGRLYLRIEGMESGMADFWAFYLHERLHPIGWAKQMGYKYQPPQVLEKQGLSEQEIQSLLDAALKEAEEQSLPADIFKDQAEITEHKFKRSMKLEAVSPRTRNHICPATVVEIIDSRYFVVEIDDLQETDPANRIRFCCHSRTPTIFPIQWTVYKGIKLTPPPGWSRPDFNWSEYLTHCRAIAASENCFDMNVGDHEFERGMKLEAVNPDSPNQICAATITKIVDNLMWVHLDSSNRIVASHVEHIGSHNLFPVGWCESNGYQLRPPRKTGLRLGVGSPRKRVAVVQPEMADGGQGKEEETEGRTYCPKIFFNHKCFSGPYLSKGRIAELPRSVGPGPLQLVMKEVLSMLISVAYKSSRVLREIQLDGAPNPAMTQQILKAKYKNKSYRAVVEICRTTAQLDDFCRQVCIKLECCPNLISPHFVGDNCPEHCSQLTKTKYTYYYGKKKRKVGRPPGGHSNLENGPKKPMKRRRRRRMGLVLRKTHTTNEEDEDNEDKASVASDTRTADSSSTNNSRDNDHKPTAAATASKRLKRKYTHHIPPPSEIRTRGAKLPRYSFERRTHKKILLSSPPQGMSSLRSKSVQLHQAQKVNRPPTPEPPPPPRRPTSPLPVDKNPLHWTIAETVEFIQTTDCSHVAKVFREQEIDGQALLLLTLPTVQEHLELKLGPAIKLCHQIERVKRVFYEQYASQS